MRGENFGTGWGRLPFFSEKPQSAPSQRYKCILYTFFCEKGILLFVAKNEKMIHSNKKGDYPLFQWEFIEDAKMGHVARGEDYGKSESIGL